MPEAATQLIDSHCHLDFEVFDQDREQVLQRATDNNISDIIIPGTEKKYWQRINKLCNKYVQLHACYGLHPYWLDRHCKQDIEHLNQFIELNRPVALGECGLDFRPGQSDRKDQLYYFDAQLAIAQQHRLPVVIHAVKSTEAAIRALRGYKNLNGMIHSFSGSNEQARQLIDMGFYISISGSATYTNAKKIKEIIRDIPISSMLIETDAPDQTDKSNANKRNEPAFIINTAEIISAIRQQTMAFISQQTTENARHLFNI